MALTRKMLKAMGIEDEKIDQIIEEHAETVNALKQQRDQYKVDAEKLPGVQKELDELKDAAEKDGENPYKAKYEELQQQFDDYKADVTAKETKAQKTGSCSKTRRYPRSAWIRSSNFPRSTTLNSTTRERSRMQQMLRRKSKKSGATLLLPRKHTVQAHRIPLAGPAATILPAAVLRAARHRFSSSTRLHSTDQRRRNKCLLST